MPYILQTDLNSPSFPDVLLERELQGIRAVIVQKMSKARAVTLIGIVPCLGEGGGRRFMFYTLIEA
jgi:hypothetical protein